MKFTIGDRVKTPDGHVITIQGMVAKTVYRAGDCKKATGAKTSTRRPTFEADDTIIWGQ